MCTVSSFPFGLKKRKDAVHWYLSKPEKKLLHRKCHLNLWTFFAKFHLFIYIRYYNKYIITVAHNFLNIFQSQFLLPCQWFSAYIYWSILKVYITFCIYKYSTPQCYTCSCYWNCPYGDYKKTIKFWIQTINSPLRKCGVILNYFKNKMQINSAIPLPSQKWFLRNSDHMCACVNDRGG
jgi:hypothetical protein